MAQHDDDNTAHGILCVLALSLGPSLGQGMGELLHFITMLPQSLFLVVAFDGEGGRSYHLGQVL